MSQSHPRPGHRLPGGGRCGGCLRCHPRPVTRSTPVPGHRRSVRMGFGRNANFGLVAFCACGWRSVAHPDEPGAVAEHTSHKIAARSGAQPVEKEKIMIRTSLDLGEFVLSLDSQTWLGVELTPEFEERVDLTKLGVDELANTRAFFDAVLRRIDELRTGALMARADQLAEQVAEQAGDARFVDLVEQSGEPPQQ
jgi:hypothetical protein